MERITLYEEFKFIERSETEVYSIWKGAHLLLFFLAFVFGSFCTFCFHMLMYLFDEKCVLFPKLLSLTSLRQNIIYEFIPEDKVKAEMLPVDFVSTQWVEKSACYLPTYVPLVSGIFGLVWTTMFLMCSAGSRVLTGLQRPWRILPPIFVFSLAMSSLCIYTSVVTHYGLHDLCMKLSEITGSTTCTYTVNVATLVYERRIRGVYQATHLTILSAWLHTACWVLSALLALFRVLLSIDFQLVRVKAELTGNIDRFLEKNETHIRTISPDLWGMPVSPSASKNSMKVHFQKEYFISKRHLGSESSLSDFGDQLYISDGSSKTSEMALVPVERKKLEMYDIYSKVSREHTFIAQLLYNIVADVTETSPLPSLSSSISSIDTDSSLLKIVRQYGQEKITSQLVLAERGKIRPLLDIKEAEEIALDLKRALKSRINILYENPTSKLENQSDQGKLESASDQPELGVASTSKDAAKTKKSSLKNTATQTQKKQRDPSTKVQIESKTSIMTSDTKLNSEKETQTKKEKQD
ncbi:uncharacterized protein LOC123720278 isoform X1 [Pieris brassicae]|uniref:uncharacterized protein LOC123720278 isoform X1 n=1 Tax=Pieris brassicae TaxID=7116 RepID=UPI001E662187|nr:uncharacterized protein LOC123720278 isoform X1 [Pieris brassicae]